MQSATSSSTSRRSQPARTCAPKSRGGSRAEPRTTDSIASNLDGQAVAVAVNGKTYSGTIGNDGSWSVNVGATDLTSLADGKTVAVTASVTDKAGNLASASDPVAVDKTATLTINTINGNGFINAGNAAAGNCHHGHKHGRARQR